MKSNAKKAILAATVCLCLLLAACGEVKPLETAIGSFDYGQTFMSALESEGVDTAAPTQGNIFLVVYLTPVEGEAVTLDTAEEYFLRGTSAVLAGQTYPLYCLAFERIDGAAERFGLVFEVAAAGYADAAEQPTIQLLLPPAAE